MFRGALRGALLALGLVLGGGALADYTHVDLAKESTATVGTGATLVVGGAVSGYLTIEEAASQVGKSINGAAVTYGIVDGSNRESGPGTYDAGTNTLTRCTSGVNCTSTNGGNRISLSGSASVGITAIADSFDELLSETEAAALYQPLDSDLTSWAGVTRASGFDTFAATPSMANLGSLLTDDASGWTTFGTTPTSANLRSLLTDEIDTGVLVFLGTPADDQVPVGDSASDTTWRTVPDCDNEANTLAYDQATNTWSCNADAGAGGSGINNVVEDTTPQAGGAWDWNGQSQSDATLTDTIVTDYNENAIRMTNDSAGATGALLELHHDSGSPADGDIAGRLGVYGGADDELVGSIALEIDDGATTTEDTRWRVTVRTAGSDEEIITAVGGNVTSSGDFTSTDDLISGDDVLLSNAGVINFNAGDCTLTEGADTLTIAGTCTLVTEVVTPDGDNTRDLGSAAATWATAHINSIELANGTANTLTATGGVLSIEGTALVLTTRTLTGGTGIAAIGDLSADRTITLDLTELTTATFGAGTFTTMTFDAGATDPVITAASNAMSFTGQTEHRIGSTTSVAQDDISSTAVTPLLQVSGTTTATSAIGILRFADDAVAATFLCGHADGGSVGTFTAVDADDDLCAIVATGADGTNNEPAAAILFEVDAATGANDMPGRITFLTTADAAATPSVRGTVKNDGGWIIGSGTTSPGNDGDVRLYSADDSASGPVLQMHHDDPSADAADLAARWEVFGGADDEEIGSIVLTINDPATTTEDTQWTFIVRTAGSDTTPLTLVADDVSVADDLLLTSGGAVINFESGDCTLTDGTNMLTMDGCDLTTEVVIPDGDNTRDLGSTGATWATFHATSWEAGNATDTTFTRVSAGVAAVEGVNILLDATNSVDAANINFDYVGTVADGTGVDGTATGEGSTYTPTLDLTEITSMTWGNGNFTTETYSGAGAIDLTWTYSTSSTAILSHNDAGASGPILRLFHDTASSADGDTSVIQFAGGADDEVIGSITFETDDGATTTEDTRFRFIVRTAGADEEVITAVGGNVTSSGDFTSTDDIISGDDVLISASGVINFDSGDCTLTDGTNVLTMDGCDLVTEVLTPDGDNTRDLGSAAATWATFHATTWEAGNATDTTIARASAGQVNVEGVAVILNDATGETNVETFIDTLASLTSFGATDGGGTGFMDATTLGLDDNTTLRFYETEANGDNYKEFVAPAAVTANTTCTLEDDANPIPDSCVGDGTDAGAGGGIANVVEDTSPQLGGDLDLLGQTIFDSTMTDEATLFAVENGFRVLGATDIDSPAFWVVSSGDGNDGSGLNLWHDSASPADGDIAGQINVLAGADDEPVGQIRMELDDGSTGSEDTQWQHVIRVAGSDLTALTLGTTNFRALYGSIFDLGSANFPALTVQGTDASGGGPTLEFYSNSSTPAASDYIAGITAFGKDSGAAAQQYGGMSWDALDVTAASEDSRLSFAIYSGGSPLTALTLGTTTSADIVYGHVFNVGSGEVGTIEIVGTSDGTGGPSVTTYANSASPADNDTIGFWQAAGKDDGGNIEFYSYIRTRALDVSNATEDSSLEFNILDAGSSVNALTLSPGNNIFDYGAEANPVLQIQTTNAGADGPEITFYHNSASPADGDTMDITMYGGADDERIGSIIFEVDDGSTGSEDTHWRFTTRRAGADAEILSLGTGAGGQTSTLDVSHSNGTSIGVLNIYSSASGATGPYVFLQHDSASPADGDTSGIVVLAGTDDEQVGSIALEVDDGATTTEDTRWRFTGRTAGADLEFLALGGTDPYTGAFSHRFRAGTTGQNGLSLHSTAEGNTGGAFTTFHDTTTPADSDIIYTEFYVGRDDAANVQQYAEFRVFNPDVSAGTEDGLLRWCIMADGLDQCLEWQNGRFYNSVNDTIALGAAGVGWKDLFLAEGGIIDWDNGDATITQTSNDIRVAGIDTFSLYNNDDDTVGVKLEFRTDDPSADANDNIVWIDGYGGADDESVGAMALRLIDPATTTEDSVWEFATDVAGATNIRMAIGDGVIIGSGTTFPGAGVMWSGGILVSGDSASFFTYADEDSADIVPAVQLNEDNANGGAMVIARYNATDANSPHLVIAKSGNATTGSHTVVASGEDLGNIVWNGSDGTNFEPAASIRAEVDGTAASDDMPGRIEFDVAADAGATLTTRMTLKNDGGLIVGTTTTSPGAGAVLSQSTAGFWVRWTANSTTILDSFNTTSIADTATGDADITIGNDFNNANWAGFVSVTDATDGWDNEDVRGYGFNAKAAGTAGVLSNTTVDGTTSATTLTDPEQWDAGGFGDPI